MSDGERKASARAAYAEGVELQDKGKPADALRRFEAAESLYDAPTHLLHIAECQALTGKLVEAAETYGTLDRKELPAGSPEIFKQAQAQGRAELQVLKPRIPTLRVVLKPDPQALQNVYVMMNDQQVPGNVAVIARPVNPGPYKVTASATGYATAQPLSFTLAEKEQKTIELTLVQSAIGAGGAPIPPPAGGVATGTGTSSAPPPYEQPRIPEHARPTSVGLLVGAKVGVFVLGGNVAKGAKLDDYAGAGGGFGLDAQLRFARILLAGLAFDWAALGDPQDKVSGVSYSTNTYYIGVNFGIVPNIDRVSFIGDVGIGYRHLGRTATGAQGLLSVDDSFGGSEFAFNAGLSIPIGPIRLIPKAGLGVGTFDDVTCRTEQCGTTSSFENTSSSAHVVFNLSLGIDWSLNFGKKQPAVASNSRL